MELLVCLYQVVYCQVEEPCRKNAFPPPDHTRLKTFVINLDLPPVERWKEVTRERKDQLHGLLDVFRRMVGDKGLKYVSMAMEALSKYLPHTYAEEMKGISEVADVSIGEVVLYNIFYEFFTACTSIIGQDSHGKLYHARNMDFGLMLGWDKKNNTWLVSEMLRKILFIADFQKDGKTIYKSTQFAGYVGIMTAIKPNKFTFSLDERFQLDGGYVGLIKWIYKIVTGGKPANWLGFFTREVMENATNYAEAKALLESKELLAPVYFILGGTQRNEATIITRNRMDLADVWALESNNKWYMLETNYDHWEKPLFFDDRRTPGNICMKQLGQENISLKGLFNVLSTRPVLNKLTVYTALMQVDAGTLDAYTQFCKDPCWPW